MSSTRNSQRPLGPVMPRTQLVCRRSGTSATFRNIQTMITDSTIEPTNANGWPIKTWKPAKREMTTPNVTSSARAIPACCRRSIAGEHTKGGLAHWVYDLVYKLHKVYARPEVSADCDRHAQAGTRESRSA